MAGLFAGGYAGGVGATHGVGKLAPRASTDAGVVDRPDRKAGAQLARKADYHQDQKDAAKITVRPLRTSRVVGLVALRARAWCTAVGHDLQPWPGAGTDLEH